MGWKRIGIPAPSWRGRAEEVFRGVRLLNDHGGFQPVVGEVAKGRPSYTSPFLNVEARAREFVGMLRDDSIDAIWCCDGGAGASYLLPILAKAWESKPWRKKPILGFSDCTFLLLYLVKLGHVCFLAPNVAVETDEQETSLLRALSEISSRNSSASTAWRSGPRPVEVFSPGRADGLFLGGTLSVIAAMIGTPYCPSFEGSLVFFEEHGVNAPGEREYLLWDKIQAIELSRKWNGASGFVVGEVEIGGPYDTDEDLFPDLWQVLDRTLVPMTNGPVVSGWPFGISRKEELLPLGVPAQLVVKDGYAELSWELPASVWES